MKIVKKAKTNLLVMSAVLITMVMGVVAIDNTSNNFLRSEVVSVYADEPEYAPPSIPALTWASLDFSSVTLAGEGTEASPYLVSNATELAYMSHMTRRSSGYTTFDGVYFRQTADIDLAGRLWTPIGTDNALRRFKGNFDGGNFEIRNMFAYSTNSTYYGLFSFIEGGEFKNINIVNAYVNNFSNSYAGIVAARALNVKVDNVHTSGLISGHLDGQTTNWRGRNNYVGGLFGYIENTANMTTNIVTNSSNTAVVRGLYNVGGIAGVARFVNMSNVTNTVGAKIYADHTGNTQNNVGGIVGSVDGGGIITFNNAINHGFVRGAYNTIGGIIGNSTNENVRLVITNSANYGTVESKNAISVSPAQDRDRVGGIIGRAFYITLDNVVNYGTITGRHEVAGLIARSERETNIIDSSNHRDAAIISTGYHVGGLIGFISNVTHITNSHNHADIVSLTTSFGNWGTGGLVGTWGGKNSTITNSTNQASVTGSGVGGAIGYVSGADIIIDGFDNTGELFSSRTTSGSNSRGTGGVIGLAANAGSTISILNSENNGVLLGSYVGGAVGNATAMGIINIHNFTNYTSIILEEITENQLPSGGNPATSVRPNVVGGIVGYSNARLTINASNNLGVISSSGSYVGGLVGRMLHSSSVISNSVNEQNVTGLHYVGGIAGEGRGQVVNSQNEGPTITGLGSSLGGIFGSTNGAYLDGVTNNALTVTGGSYTLEGNNVGGLIGVTNSGSTVNIKDSINNANVFGRTAVGGLIGQNRQITNINNSHNNGVITGYYYYVGGLVGQVFAGNLNIVNSDNRDDIIANTHYITTIGNVSYAAGGLIGSITTSNAILTITGSENEGNVTGQFVGGIIGYTNISVVSNSKLISVANYGNVVSTYDEALLPLIFDIDGRSTNYVNLDQYGGYAGGLVGAGGTTTGSVTILNSINYGNVEGRFIGGLVGSIHTADITNSYSDSSVILTVNFEHEYTRNNLVTYNTVALTKGVAGLVYTSHYFVRVFNTTSNVQFDLGSSRVYAAGGLLGVVRNVVIKNSTNMSNIIGSQVDLNENYVGGLVARINNATTVQINDVYSYGNINFAARYIGGLVGRVVNTTGATASANGVTIIKNAVVEANIFNNITTENADSYVAGVVGEVYYAFDISNVMVNGNIQGSYYVGGIIARIGIQFNTLSNLPYIIKNVNYNGVISGTQRNGNAALGGFVGQISFEGNAVAASPSSIDLTIENSYTVAQITNNINRRAGYVGHVIFRAIAILQSVNINNSLFVEDVVQGYTVSNTVAFIQNNTVDRIVNYTNSNAVLLDDLTNPLVYQDWQIGGTGVEQTYWSISTAGYNNGRPYLSNMFEAQVIFNANNGEFEESVTTQNIETKVGNKLTLSELLVGLPYREFYEFLGWSTNPSGNQLSDVEYVYGTLLEIESENITLYAVWQPERILIDIVGLGNLYTDLGVLVNDYYITADTTHELRAVVDIGENFLYWEVYNPATSNFVTLPELNDTIVGLDTILDEAFINTYSYNNNNGRKTITFQQIVTGVNESVAINFASGLSNDLASVRVNGANYRIGSNIIVEQGQTFNFTLNVKNHYTFNTIVIKDSAGVDITGLDFDNIYSYNSLTGVHTVTVNERLFIYLSFVKTNYNVVVKQVLNNVNLSAAVEFERDNDTNEYLVDLVNDEALSTTVSIGDIFNGLLGTTTNDYKFVRFMLYNSATNQYTAYAPSTSALTESFLTAFTSNGNLEILAIFERTYLVTIDTSGNGEVVAYIRENDNSRTTIDGAGTYVLENANVVIEAHAADNSVFVNFTGVNANDIIGSVASFRVNGAVNVVANFELAYYSIVTQTIDNNNQPITDNVAVQSALVNLEEVTIGTLVYKVGLLNNQIPGYLFEGWYLNVNGVLISINDIQELVLDDEGNINSFYITEQFATSYANDESEIVIVAKYSELYLITLRVNDTNKGSYTLWQVVDAQEDTLLDPNTTELPYGMVVKIVPVVANSTYYSFKDYTGLVDNDNYNLTDKTLTFTVNTNRAITLNFESVILVLEKQVDTQGARGKITLNTDNFAVGETITLTFEADSGFEIRNWIIVDKNGKAHTVTSLANNDNYDITFNNDTIVLIVNENWLQDFGMKLQTDVSTMMNSTYFMVLLVGGIATPVLLAGIVFFVIMNNKKKAQATKAAKHSAANKFGLNQQEFLKNLVDDDSNNSKKDKQ